MGAWSQTPGQGSGSFGSREREAGVEGELEGAFQGKADSPTLVPVWRSGDGLEVQ